MPTAEKKRTLSDEAINLLCAVKATIARFPSEFDIKVFHCETAHCIAGWIDLLCFDRTNQHSFACEYRARMSLGLPGLLEEGGHGFCPATTLFYLNEWPEDLYFMYTKARSDRGRAEAAGKAIDRWIEGDGEFVQHA